MKRKQTRPWMSYPLGTKAHAVGGGFWTKVEAGWQWNNGDIFPTPGGEAVGRCIEMPNQFEQEAARRNKAAKANFNSWFGGFNK